MKKPVHPEGVLFYTLAILSIGGWISLFFTALPFWYHWLVFGIGAVWYVYMLVYAIRQRCYGFIIATTALLIFVAVWFSLSEPSYSEWYLNRRPGESRFV